MTRMRTPLALLAAFSFLAAACGSDGTGPGDGATTPRTDVPAELVGTWYHGEVSPSNFYDPASSHWDNAYGEGMFYSLTADGHYESGCRIYTSSYGCNDAALFWRRGTVAVDPATGSFTLYPRKAIPHSISDCHPEWNYTKPISKDPETIYWQFGDDGYGSTALLLAYANTGASAFYPWHLARTGP
jgi:hypothetical protein